jgi:prepilin-type N-terminal cleavage/methylation domain-containing protein
VNRTARRSQAGFTLLELIIAIGISVVLLFAVYQATAMHFVQLQSGREIAEHAQLVRGLTAIIQRDLRMAYTTYEPPASASTGGELVMLTEYDAPKGGVHGYNDSLSVVVRVSPGDLDFAAVDGEDATPLYDLRMIRYHVGSLDDAGGATGLIREQVFRMVDAEFSADPLDYTRANMLAEEVRAVEFAYFDGTEWTSEWDGTNETAPAAIEVILAVALPAQAAGQLDEQSAATAAADERIRTYRIVVALPQVTATETAAAAEQDTTETADS